MGGTWGMKTFQHNPIKLLMIAIACCFVASATTQAGEYSSRSASPNGIGLTDNARLLVWRAADFGTLISISLYIDGVQVATLGRNQGYEAILRPGQHVFSLGTSPCPYGKTRLTHRHVTVTRGQTYAFTALWKWSDRPVLETSDTARSHWPGSLVTRTANY